MGALHASIRTSVLVAIALSTCSAHHSSQHRVRPELEDVIMLPDSTRSRFEAYLQIPSEHGIKRRHPSAAIDITVSDTVDTIVDELWDSILRAPHTHEESPEELQQKYEVLILEYLHSIQELMGVRIRQVPRVEVNRDSLYTLLRKTVQTDDTDRLQKYVKGKYGALIYNNVIFPVPFNDQKNIKDFVTHEVAHATQIYVPQGNLLQGTDRDMWQEGTATYISRRIALLENEPEMTELAVFRWFGSRLHKALTLTSEGKPPGNNLDVCDAFAYEVFSYYTAQLIFVNARRIFKADAQLPPLNIAPVLQHMATSMPRADAIEYRCN